MLVVETIAKIRRDHLVRGVPIKKIARDLRVSKNTVRKVVRGDETSFSYERKIQPMPKLGPWVEELERQLKANEKKARKDRLSLLRIHEDLVSLGYKGGYDAVRRYARAWRRRWRLLSPSQAFVPLIFDPGEAYQFDWSHEYARLAGATTRVKAAHMRLCHSRMYLVQIFPRESQEMVFEAHERARDPAMDPAGRLEFDRLNHAAFEVILASRERCFANRAPDVVCPERFQSELPALLKFTPKGRRCTVGAYRREPAIRDTQIRPNAAFAVPVLTKAHAPNFRFRGLASEPYCGWLFASRHGSLDHLPDPIRRRFNLPIADMSVAQGHRRV